MPLTCQHDGCDCAVTIIDDNGVTDPANGDRWERYECPKGHTFTQVLTA